MSNRIVNISMLHHTGLAAMEWSLRDYFGVESNEYHDNLIYASMIQAGIQRFRIVGHAPKSIRDSDFLRHRCEEYSFNEYEVVMDSIRAVIESHATGSPTHSSKHSDLFPLVWFLTELVFSLKTKSAMVSVLPVPSVGQYSGILTPEMLSAVGTLIQKVHPIQIDLPIPQSEILSDDVKVFHELVRSDLFASYSSSHELLESSDADEQSAIRSILADAKALRFRFSSLLDAKRVMLSLLPVTASLIDTVCGKFPGSLANIFGDALTEALKSRQRITIYNYGDTHFALLEEHYRAKRRNTTK